MAKQLTVPLVIFFFMSFFIFSWICGCSDSSNNSTDSIPASQDVDKPSITASITPTPNDDGWNHNDVTITFECDDPSSQIIYCSDPVIIDNEGANQEVTGVAIDEEGNLSSTNVYVNLDKTAPVIEIASPEDGLDIIGHDLPFSIDIKGTVSDDVSGIKEVMCNDSVASLDGGELNHSLSLINGANTINITAFDLAGNVSNTPDIQVNFFEPEIELAYVDDFELVWSDYGSEGSTHVSIFKPILPEGFHALGHFAQPGLLTKPNGYMLLARELKSGALAHPVGYHKIWDSAGLGSDLPISIWHPEAPEGYRCLGCVAGLSEPSTDEVVCIKQEMSVLGKIGDPIWNNMGTPSLQPVMVWQNNPDRKNTVDVDIKRGQYGIYTGTFCGVQSWFMEGIEPTSLDRRYVKPVNMAPENIEPLVQNYGPQIWHHPLEGFFPDDPDIVLDSESVTLCNGIVPTESDFNAFTILERDCWQTSHTSLLDDFNTMLEYRGPGYRYWLNIDLDDVAGNIYRAKAIVNVLPIDVLFTDLQFWIFYPFNGPGRTRIGPLHTPFSMGEDVHLTNLGRHYGDWEHVTLRFLNSTNELVAVYMSRHGQGQWFSQNYFFETLQFSYTKPVVYSAKYSHALYNAIYSQIVYDVTYSALANVWLWDHTGLGYLFDTSEQGSYEIVHSWIRDVPVNEKPWLQYPGRWGQYEKLAETFDIIYQYTETEIGAGPYGPTMKDDWNYGDPDDAWYWQAEVHIE